MDPWGGFPGFTFPHLMLTRLESQVGSPPVAFRDQTFQRSFGESFAIGFSLPAFSAFDES
jgi:hypothetical protein